MPIPDKFNRWQANRRKGAPPLYHADTMGYLPQGAPTSPMLANLAVRQLDEDLMSIAVELGLTYTRYADDLTFSSISASFHRSHTSQLITRVYTSLSKHQLKPNTTKTHVVPPNARKVVLGLLVDGDKPQLTRHFRSRMRQHLYFLTHPDIGPISHAKKRGFQNLAGLQNHIYGLVAYAGQVDPTYADRCRKELDSVKWH